MALSGTRTTFFPRPAWASSSSLEPFGVIVVGPGRTNTGRFMTLGDLSGGLNLAFPLFTGPPEYIPGNCLQKKDEKKEKKKTLKFNYHFQ